MTTVADQPVVGSIVQLTQGDALSALEGLRTAVARVEHAGLGSDPQVLAAITRAESELLRLDVLAVGGWFAVTHADLGHDHHCVTRTAIRPRPDTVCTCGWAKAEPALERLAEAWRVAER